jgi:ABC-type multidrug transport system fused ATPase/permease subunit
MKALADMDDLNRHLSQSISSVQTIQILTAESLFINKHNINIQKIFKSNMMNALCDSVFGGPLTEALIIALSGLGLYAGGIFLVSSQLSHAQILTVLNTVIFTALNAVNLSGSISLDALRSPAR